MIHRTVSLKTSALNVILQHDGKFCLKNKLKQSWWKNKTQNKTCHAGLFWICFSLSIKPSEVEGILEVQCVSSCIWLTYVAVAFTCQLMFEHFQTHSGLNCDSMSQYQGDIFNVWFSFGPWLDPRRALVSLNLSGVDWLWCQLWKPKNINFVILRPPKVPANFTWQSRWNASQICWNYFAYPSKRLANGKQLEKWDKNKEKNQSDVFLFWLNK